MSQPRRALFRWILFGLLLFATLFWAFQGLSLSARLTDPESPTQAWAREAIERYDREDPQIAGLIRQSRRESRRLAILRAIEQTEGRARLKRVAEGRIPPDASGSGLLVKLATDPVLAPDDEARTALTHGYGGAFALLRQEGGDEAVDALSFTLASHAGKDSWTDARQDPAALVVAEAVSDPDLRRFHRENSEWLSELLVELLAEGDSDARRIVRTVLAAARDFHPLPRRAYLEHGGAPAFLLFLPADRPGPAAAGFGPLLRMLDERDLPLADALDIAAANAHFLLDRIDRTGYPSTAAELVEQYRTRRWIWDLARETPLALEADLLLPDVGERLLRNRKLIENGVLDFLFTYFEDEKNPKVLRNAALAVDQYGDLALFELNRHREDRRLRELLATQDFRVVAYAGMRGDAGLDDALKNPQWIDKYFGPDGKPLKNRWWEDVPIVGGPARLVSELARGHPVTWGEIGWATLDLLDGALLVATLGTSAEVTGAKQAFRETARRTLRQAATHSASRVGGSFLRRVAAGAAVRGGVRLFAWCAWPLRWAGSAAVRAARAAPPALRKWVLRGVLAATLFESFRHRTWPMLKRVAAEAPEAVARELADLVEKGLAGTARAVGDLVGRATGLEGGPRAAAVYAVLLLLLGAATLRAMPRRAAA